MLSTSLEYGQQYHSQVQQQMQRNSQQQYQQPQQQALTEQERLNKLKAAIQKKRDELDQSLTNMLIHLYNGKQPDEYIGEYKRIQERLLWLLKHANINSDELMKIFNSKILDIICQVKDKLNKDAKDQKVVHEILKNPTTLNPNADTQLQPKKNP